MKEKLYKLLVPHADEVLLYIPKTISKRALTNTMRFTIVLRWFF